MEHTKKKFLLELENFFKNLPEFTVGNVMMAFYNEIENKEELFNLSDSEAINKLEKAQLINTEIK